MKFKYYHSQKIARVYVLRYLLIRLEKYVTKTAAVTIKKKKKARGIIVCGKKKNPKTICTKFESDKQQRFQY